MIGRGAVAVVRDKATAQSADCDYRGKIIFSTYNVYSLARISRGRQAIKVELGECARRRTRKDDLLHHPNVREGGILNFASTFGVFGTFHGRMVDSHHRQEHP